MSNWVLLTILGAFSIIVGILALLNPFPASLAVLQLTAWSFLILGALQAFEAYRAEEWSGKLWSLLLGIIAIFIGINLLGKPLAGLITLTILLGSMFLVSGIFKFAVGWKIQKQEFKIAILISGAASLIIGLIILSNFPVSAATSLGILLGVELISNGVSAVALGFSRKTGAAAKATQSDG